MLMHRHNGQLHLYNQAQWPTPPIQSGYWGILWGRPVSSFLGSVRASAVRCPAAIRWGTAFQKACSPVHNRFHCSLSMCHTPASHWSLLPPTASILWLRSYAAIASARVLPSPKWQDFYRCWRSRLNRRFFQMVFDYSTCCVSPSPHTMWSWALRIALEKIWPRATERETCYVWKISFGLSHTQNRVSWRPWVAEMLLLRSPWPS